MSSLDTHRSGPPSRRFRLGKNRAVVGGVCAGIADYFGWDVALVRIGFALSTIFLAGSLAIAYLVIWAIAD